MKRHLKRRPLGRWLKGLFGSRNTRVQEPDALRAGMSKKLIDEVELVSRIESISWKEAAILLIEKGFIDYLVKKIEEDSDIERRASQLNAPRGRHTTRFARVTRKFAKERDTDKK